MKNAAKLLLCAVLAACVLCSCSVNANVNPTETTDAVTQTTTEKTTENKTGEPAQQQTETASETATEKQTVSKADTDKKLKIVLDPGHDSTAHTRNHPGLGVNEQDLNFKIARACYRKLKQYDCIDVYITRKNGDCPNSDKKYSDDKAHGDACIYARTDFAEKKNADIFVSFHCNSSTGKLGAKANGAEVYVTKHSKLRVESELLGKLVLEHITSALDLKSRGLKTRVKPEKGTYDDGTPKDYYYLLSNNIDNNRPAIIIEHAYMDNAHDNKILRDDESLKKLGEADADAIIDCYGLNL